MKYRLGNIPYSVTAEELDDYLLRIGCFCTEPPRLHIDAQGESTGTATVVTEMGLCELQQRLARRDAFQGLRLRAEVFHRKAE